MGMGSRWRVAGIGDAGFQDIFSRAVNEKVPFSFAGRKDAGTDAWPGRKLKGTRVELKRNEAFGYAF